VKQETIEEQDPSWVKQIRLIPSQFGVDVTDLPVGTLSREWLRRAH
jgi:hypothetical protein